MSAIVTSWLSGMGRAFPLLECPTVQIVLVLGQGFAGIFDYLEIQRGPTTLVAGATKLHESISYSGTGLNFQANIFLAFFFNWISNPVDTDGDQSLSVCDAFKSAAIGTNAALKNLKIQLTKTYDQWCLKEQAALPGILDPILRANKEEGIQQNALLYHTHQEPWMLNAHDARNILFK